MTPVAIGSRGSQLALAQARLAQNALGGAGVPSRIVVVETEGDRRPADTAWGEGAFVKAIEAALLAGQVDVAVHSAKDVPTAEDSRLIIGAYLPRADPRDALVVADGTRSLEALPTGSRLGTDSPRRAGFLSAARPDLLVHPLHGNVDTRLRRLDEGETDALVLACAGLDRLGLGDRIAQRLGPEILPPAPGQGALAVQVRRDDRHLLEMTSAIDDHATRTAVEAERAVLVATGGGCRAPVGALGVLRDQDLQLLGGRADPYGGSATIRSRSGRVQDVAAIVDALVRELWPETLVEAPA